MLLVTFFFLSCSNERREKNDDGIVVVEANETKRLDLIGFVNIQNDQAKKLFWKASELENNGDFYLSINKLNKANQFISEANKIEPNNADILNEFGVIKMRLHQFNLSEKYFRQAIKINSSCFGAFINMGLMYYYWNKYNDGIIILKSMNFKKASNSFISSNYFHLFMNYTGLQNCDSAYCYYMKFKNLNTNKLSDDNIEKFKREKYDILNCK
ncbi:MAG: hypothetical protein Q8861_07140 [Bacteroidota bacterium]|nr:hypothetical protein [Bacteroidota bacterium]